MILGLYNNFLNSSFQLLQNNDLKEWTEINLQKMKKIRWSVIVREGGIFLYEIKSDTGYAFRS